MPNYNSLKATIDAQIKANGVQAITGPILNAVLTAMINTIGNGYSLQGSVAQTTDNPGAPDNLVAYIAAGPGTYTNFGGTVIPDDGHAYLLTWDTSWHAVQLPLPTYDLANGKQDALTFDDAPTPESDNPVKSNGIAEALDDKQDKDTGDTAGHVAVMDGNGNSVDGGKALADLATKEDVEAVEQEVAQVAGEAGLAEAVIDTDNAGTEQQFTFRKSGGDGGAYYRKIKGKTIVVDDQLASNDAEAVETTGANQWDEEWELGYIDVATTGGNEPSTTRIRSKNYIPVLGNTTYFYMQGQGSVTGRLAYYDANKDFISGTNDLALNAPFTTPANAAFIRFSPYDDYGITYNHDICINLSNPAINGQYFPYWKRTLQLGITTKEDTDGNVPFPNGLQSCPVAQDEATKEGGIVRVGTRAYQAGDESDADVITDGTNTNYALATPVPFTWAEPLNLGVKVDENGTERAVAPEGATAPSAPFVADTTYTMSVARMVAKLQTI